MNADAIKEWLAGAGEYLLDVGPRVVGVVVMMFVALAVIHRVAKRVQRLMHGRLASPADAKRATTIGHLIRDCLRTVVWIVGGLMLLGEFGIDMKPLLAAAGIGGLAIGFGAQSLVKDVITGFFLLFDDRVRVGDVVEVAGVSGAVEEIRLRTIVLRDLGGNVHVVPNGSIDRVTNMTREHAYALLDAEVGYGEDVDAVMAVLTTLGRDLAADPAFSGVLLAPLEILGVETLGANGVSVRFRQKTVAGEQWRVAREIRRQMKRRFDEASIEIPFPQRTLWIGQPKRGPATPLRVVRAASDGAAS